MDYWKILGLTEGASLDEIKKAYRILAKKYHPDHNSSPDSVRKFREIQAAYEYLKMNPGHKTSSSYSNSYTNSQKQTSEENKQTYEEKKTEEKSNLGSTYRRNYHERYNRRAYTGTTSDSSRYHNSNNSQRSSETFSSNSHKSYSTSSSTSSYKNYSTESFRKAYYTTSESGSKSYSSEESIWEQIGRIILYTVEIIIGIPAAIIGLFILALIL